MAAGIAAPLLASVSFALVVLALSMPDGKSRYIEQAVLLFVIAGLSFVTTVQAAMWEQRYRQAPRERRTWNALARGAYHVGVVALLIALGALLFPPGHIPTVRQWTLGLIVFGALAEFAWICLSGFRSFRAWRRSMDPTASGSPASAPTRSRLGQRAQAFTNDHPYVGPAVWMSAIAWFIVQVVVGYDWSWKFADSSGQMTGKSVHYSLVVNTISDLGVTTKYKYPSATSTLRISSPWHWIFNADMVLLGLVMLAGSILLYGEFSEETGWQHKLSLVGFTLQGAAGVGAAVVGFVPENSHPLGHELGAAFALGIGNLSIFLLALAITVPRYLRRYMLFWSPVSVAAIILYAIGERLGLGGGGMERLSAYPEIVWLISFGFYIWSSYRFADGAYHRSIGDKPAINRLDWTAHRTA